MQRVTIVLGFMVILAVSVSVTGKESTKTVLIGDPAPSLDDATWLRGGPHDDWQPGHVYVLDFWATWCAPCLEMMPAYQTLQDRFAEAGAHVIGVAIWSEKGPMTPVQALAKHPQLQYAVAEDREGQVAQAFMAGTESGGLPTVMVVDREGRLAWVGEHGDELERVVLAVTTGSFDLSAAKTDDDQRRQSQRLFAEIDELRRAGRPGDAATLVDKVIALDESRNGWAYAMKYQILARDRADLEAAANVAEQFLALSSGRNPYFNYIFALRLTHGYDPEQDPRDDLDLAQRLIGRAIELAETPDSDTLVLQARIFSLRGQATAAVRAQRLALEAAALAEQPGLKATLDEYLESAQK
jgi:thiol-disulfide isomerase/thioredoxin